MRVRKHIIEAFPTLLLGALTMGSIVISAVTYGDDAPPPPGGQEGSAGAHRNPAWAACKKQADDQKLGAGEARHEFIRNCIKAATAPAPAPAAAAAPAT